MEIYSLEMVKQVQVEAGVPSHTKMGEEGSVKVYVLNAGTFSLLLPTRIRKVLTACVMMLRTLMEHFIVAVLVATGGFALAVYAQLDNGQKGN